MKQQFSSKTLIALLCGAVATFNAAAQNSQSTVIVSGSRFEENLNEVPANVQVITREEIAESTSTNIPDILSQIGGLNIRSTAGGQLNLGATVDMGGYGPTAKDTTLILVDGQRINPIDSSGISWESIPLDSINRIEILRGGASVQYGNGALGGVINIITNGGSKTLNQASTSYGSFNTLVNNAIFRNTIDQTTVQLSANTSNTNGWRQNSAANAYSFDGKVTQSLGGKDNVYADLFYSYSNQQMPGGTLGQVGQGNPQLAKFNNIGSGTTVDNSGIRMGLAKALSDTFNLEVDSFYSAKTTFFTQPYYSTTAAGVGAFPTISPSFTKYEGWQANFSPRIKGDFGKFGTSIVGYEFNKASQSSAASYSSIMNQAAQAQGAVINPISSSANAS
ncbi:TonB-dependent receptor, partial [Polynucleobacter sp. 35-46-11]